MNPLKKAMVAIILCIGSLHAQETETKDTLKKTLIDNLSFKPTEESFFEYLDNKHLCFDIGGKKHKINLEISGSEAKITSIKDY